MIYLMPKFLPPLLFIVLIFNGLPAQTPVDSAERLEPRPAFELCWQTGTLLRHTPKLTVQTGQRVPGFEVGVRLPTLGRREWQQVFGFPVVGVAVSGFSLGGAAHGNVFCLTSNITFLPVRLKNWAIAVRLGGGLGYVTRPYGFFDNPGQNAIGSHFNAVAQFRLGTEFRVNAHLRATAGASLTHASNGGWALPNLGVNIPTGYFSIAYSPEKEAVARKKNIPCKSEGRFGGLLQAGAAWVEYIVVDGARHPVWSASGMATWRLGRANRLMLGVDWEFNRSVYAWGLQTTAFDAEAEARRGATRWAVKLADEFLFGRLGVAYETGFYVGGPAINQYVLTRQFSKVAVRYYLPSLPGLGWRPHIGLSLKAHRAVAEYLSINAGMDLGGG